MSLASCVVGLHTMWVNWSWTRKWLKSVLLTTYQAIRGSTKSGKMWSTEIKDPTRELGNLDLVLIW